MTISIQRWLSVRLDLFGNIVVLGIGLFAAGFRTSVDPSRIGVTLSYTLGSMFLFLNHREKSTIDLARFYSNAVLL